MSTVLPEEKQAAVGFFSMVTISMKTEATRPVICALTWIGSCKPSMLLKCLIDENKSYLFLFLLGWLLLLCP